MAMNPRIDRQLFVGVVASVAFALAMIATSYVSFWAGSLMLVSLGIAVASAISLAIALVASIHGLKRRWIFASVFCFVMAAVTFTGQRAGQRHLYASVRAEMERAIRVAEAYRSENGIYPETLAIDCEARGGRPAYSAGENSSGFSIHCNTFFWETCSYWSDSNTWSIWD